jgi:hypothetical protein
MKPVWKRIRAWLDANAPKGYGSLRLAVNRGSDYVVVNIDPRATAPGRLMIQRADSARPDPLAPSFTVWLEHFADELEGGVFAFSEADGEVMLADELDLD